MRRESFVRARLPRLAARTDSLQGSDTYRIYDMVETAKEWRRATVLKYAPTPHPLTPARADFDGPMRAR